MARVNCYGCVVAGDGHTSSLRVMKYSNAGSVRMSEAGKVLCLGRGPNRAFQSTEGRQEHLKLTVQPDMRILVLLNRITAVFQKQAWSMLRYKSG